MFKSLERNACSKASHSAFQKTMFLRLPDSGKGVLVTIVSPWRPGWVNKCFTAEDEADAVASGATES